MHGTNVLFGDILFSQYAASTRDTALHFASMFGHIDAMRALKEFGADVFAEDQKGNTARSRALSLGMFQIADTLGTNFPITHGSEFLLFTFLRWIW